MPPAPPADDALKLEAPYTERPLRRSAHLPVTVRKFRSLPFFRYDAQLVDISEQGAKLQFGRDLKAKSGDRFWVNFDFLKLDVKTRSQALALEVECRWYNRDGFLIGVSFADLTADERTHVTQLIDDLKKAGRLPC